MRTYSYAGFLPAKKLNLLPDERAAMIRLLKRLDRGAFRYHGDGGLTAEEEQKPVMDMQNILKKPRRTECGTVGCIAGHVALDLFARGKLPGAARHSVVKRAENFYADLIRRSRALDRLCHAQEFPDPSGDCHMFTAEPRHVRAALRSFLRTGDPKWEKAINAKR